MGIGMDIANKYQYNSNVVNNYKIKNINSQNEKITSQINKSVQFKELQNRIKLSRKNSAPEYLFDEKGRKILYSALNEENNLEEEKNRWKNELMINKNNYSNKNYKKKSYDLFEGRSKINEDELLNDFILNYNKKGEEIRNRYMSQLINKGIWMPNIEKKSYNSIIIFDWDDTLFPTTFLISKGVLNSFLQLTKIEKRKISKLENLILELLTLSVEKGDVYIITNADKGWVEYSSKLFYPSISDILDKIIIISAKNNY